MPYYGDYYAGDPGLFSGIGRVLKGVVGIAAKIAPGPIGTIAGVANRLIGGGGRGTPGAMKMVSARAPARARARPRARARTKRRKLKFGSPAWRRKYMRA